MFVLLAAAAILGSACNPDNNNPSNSVPSIVTDGTWVVSYFWDKTKDETHKFNGYTFVFEPNGTFRATAPGVNRTGTWNVNSSQTKLIINIAGTQPLDELNDDWLIVERSATLIKLRDDNDTHEELLHFQKR